MTTQNDSLQGLTILRLVLNRNTLGSIDDQAFNGQLLDSLIELDLNDNNLGQVWSILYCPESAIVFPNSTSDDIVSAYQLQLNSSATYADLILGFHSLNEFKGDPAHSIAKCAELTKSERLVKKDDEEWLGSEVSLHCLFTLSFSLFLSCIQSHFSRALSGDLQSDQRPWGFT